MARASTTKPRAATAPRMRRTYFETRFGQLHVHGAMPAGGGFDEATTLVCFHQSPMSGRVFRGLLELMGRDRSVYAPDTPGFGESDPPPAQPTIADYAGAMLDFLDQMRFRKVDLLGLHTGSLIATEVALARPELVRRIVMCAVPLLTEEERAAFRQSPWPLPPAEDGSHLMKEWQFSQKWRGPGVTLEQLARGFADKLRNGPQAWWGASAAMDYPARERLALLRAPVLVLRPKDDLWEATARVKGVLREARIVDLPQYGHGLFDVAPQAVVEASAEFLRG
ncbi:MAG: alpha/beta fold hydrolase [Gammaproteobacteria bacterium]|nr:alpha/beta fold hydrolase [Gammaproteobacteria bacterium]